MLLLSALGCARLLSRCPDDPPVAEVLQRAMEGASTECDLDALDDFVALRKESFGPVKQDIRAAWSTDGKDFAVLDGTVIETAAVPEVVQGPDHRYYLYYVDGDIAKLPALAREHSQWMITHGIPGIGALGLAVSSDGRNFQKIEDFQVIGLPKGMVVDPEVVRQPDGTWRMYYVGMPVEEYLGSKWEYPEQHTVWWASSRDLVHWEQRGQAVRGPFADPTVTCRANDRCMMASFGLQWGLSDDGGVHFRHDGDWKVAGFAPDFAVYPDGGIRMFYNSRAKGAKVYSVYAADGEHFAPEEGERLSGAYGEAVTTTPAPGGWFMYFHTFKPGVPLPF